MDKNEEDSRWRQRDKWRMKYQVWMHFGLLINFEILNLNSPFSIFYQAHQDRQAQIYCYIRLPFSIHCSYRKQVWLLQQCSSSLRSSKLFSSILEFKALITIIIHNERKCKILYIVHFEVHVVPNMFRTLIIICMMEKFKLKLPYKRCAVPLIYPLYQLYIFAFELSFSHQINYIIFPRK